MSRATVLETNFEHIQVRPMTGSIGAEICGPDLSKPLKAAVRSEIRRALLDWRVVFFRDQTLTHDQQIAFGTEFGSVETGHPTLPATIPDHPEVLVLRNEAHADQLSSFERRWHTDLTWQAEPSMASILYGVQVPPYGGDTQWFDLGRAYDTLSPQIQALIDGLHAVHQNHLHPLYSDLAPSVDWGTQRDLESKTVRAVHPVVRIHPDTGQRVLFVNPTFTDHIVELNRRESRNLLDLLFEHVNRPEFCVRFRWKRGSVAFWDNRATAHVVIDDLPAGFSRTMHRITLAGEKTTGPSGTASYAVETPDRTD